MLTWLERRSSSSVHDDAGAVAARWAGVSRVHAQHVEHVPAEAGNKHGAHGVEVLHLRTIWRKCYASLCSRSVLMQHCPQARRLHHACLKLMPTAFTATSTSSGLSLAAASPRSTGWQARLAREPRGMGRTCTWPAAGATTRLHGKVRGTHMFVGSARVWPKAAAPFVARG